MLDDLQQQLNLDMFGQTNFVIHMLVAVEFGHHLAGNKNQEVLKLESNNRK